MADVTPPSEDQLAMVIELLPDDAGDYAWNSAKALERWAGSVYRTVREYWVDRVNDTAGYLDLSNEGLPASQLFDHARQMLAYWDSLIATSEAEEAADEAEENAVTVSRKIVRV